MPCAPCGPRQRGRSRRPQLPDRSLRWLQELGVSLDPLQAEVQRLQAKARRCRRWWSASTKAWRIAGLDGLRRRTQAGAAEALAALRARGLRW
jgi:hypothetical protein